MLRILLVEDEFLVRQVAFDELGDAGHSVVEAANGDEAAGILEHDRAFDMVFTDIRMPGALDGWGVGAAARRLIPGIKVLYCTGYSETHRALEAGEAFLTKPYRLSEMLALVESLTSLPSATH
jgi:CheY-like chemotaxis protein